MMQDFLRCTKSDFRMNTVCIARKAILHPLLTKAAYKLVLHFHNMQITLSLIICKWDEWVIIETAYHPYLYFRKRSINARIFPLLCFPHRFVLFYGNGFCLNVCSSILAEFSFSHSI